jgi:type II secretion system protein N
MTEQDGRSRLRAAALAAAVAVAAVTLFGAFLIASFPYSDTASALLAPYQLKLTYQAQHPRLPFGVRLEDASVVRIADGPPRSLVRSPEITLTPSLSAVLFGQPGLDLRAELYAGIVAAQLKKDADVINLVFQLDAVDLAQCAPLQQFGPAFKGLLSGTGSALIRGPQISDNGGTATVAGHDVILEITRGFPPIHLGAISGRLLLDAGVLTFQELEAHGGDLDARATGAIRLGSQLGDSTISARVYLTPTASGRAHFGLFLKMLPHPPTEGPYYLRGPLYEPSLS